MPSISVNLCATWPQISDGQILVKAFYFVAFLYLYSSSIISSAKNEFREFLEGTKTLISIPYFNKHIKLIMNG